MSRTLEGTLGTLSRNQVDALRRCADQVCDFPLAELLRDANEHLAAARRAHETDPLVNTAARALRAATSSSTCSFPARLVPVVW